MTLLTVVFKLTDHDQALAIASALQRPTLHRGDGKALVTLSTNLEGVPIKLTQIANCGKVTR